MEKIIENLAVISGVIGGICGYMFGGWDNYIITLVIVVMIDFCTGLIAAWQTKKLDSRVGFKGIAKKVYLFLIVALAVQVDRLIGTDVHVIRVATCFFYIANEGLSILENGGKLGINYPIKLKQALEQIKDKGESK